MIAFFLKVLSTKLKTAKRLFAIANTVNDASFWARLQDLVALLKPVVDAQAACESNVCSLKHVMLELQKIYAAFAGSTLLSDSCS